MAIGEVSRKRLRVRGIVQGVGFRPFVYGLATRLELGGFVLNDAAGVLIEIQGPVNALEAFRARLTAELPPLALVEAIDEEDAPVAAGGSFEIRASDGAGASRAPVSADVATCVACLEEVLDPRARRHGYAFTNCTNCGPRFTITRRVPYDRPGTTMARFTMCADCAREYEDPRDRRFHAQPIACPECGPELGLLDDRGRPLTDDPIAGVAALLRAGRIVAIKGLGGYHLACDATNEVAVAELRRRKHREEKPFAVMVPHLEAACRVAETTPDETATLASRRRPIVLVQRRRGAPIAPSVAPGNRQLGIMLPYTPLHHLLMRRFRRPIVLTSGNLSDEPIAYRDEDALERLAGIADAFLVHDREIHVRCDDSVVRVIDGDDYPLRRARGYAPEPLTVRPAFIRPVLAAGPELKHTFCLGVGERAILSHHIGDLETWEAMSAFMEGVEHFKRVFDVEPEVVAHDLHPEYLSTKWAQSLDGVERSPVQHHHAHIASCLVDNRRADRVIGLALDGTGFGDDGAIWGCEVLACDLTGYKRVAHLRYVPLAGGAAAVREPWRMAATYLDAAFGERARTLDLDFVRRTGQRWAPILSLARTGTNAPPTSSAGRLFDAAAALCGVRERVSYEGQAAAELEQLADPKVTFGYHCTLRGDELDGVELVAALAEDRARGTSPAEAAAAFHNGLAAALVSACENVRAGTGLSTVALSGGTWQNLLLLRRTRMGLRAGGFEVLIHHRVPPNDGGISLGQAAIANACIERGSRRAERDG
ncbi:MAG: carbamoyltransferase HypF [Actinomycetota bacterium]